MRDTEGAGSGPGCPTWCHHDHVAEGSVDDRHHRGAVRHAVVVTGHPMLAPDAVAEPDVVVARLVRRLDSEQVWVDLRSEEGGAVRLVVTLESARRVRGLIEELIALAVAS